MTSDDEVRLLTMIKPDGFIRTCTPGVQEAVRAAWADVLAWLNGADPDELSHAAVVARELAVPSVVNVDGVTRALKTGDRIRLDGDAGVIEKL